MILKIANWLASSPPATLITAIGALVGALVAGLAGLITALAGLVVALRKQSQAEHRTGVAHTLAAIQNVHEAVNGGLIARIARIESVLGIPAGDHTASDDGQRHDRPDHDHDRPGHDRPDEYD